MPDLKLYAVVVTYNAENWIRKCLISLINSNHPLEIIVIDNSSSDRTREVILEEFSTVDLIASPKNLGFGKANNIGIEKANENNADFVLLINQDTYVDPHMIGNLLKTFESQEGFGILAPFQLSYSGDKVETYFNDYVVAHYAPSYINDLYFNSIQPVYQAAFIHAAAWLLPMSTIMKVGGFDPLFFHYGEDSDYVQRLRHKGLKIGFVPQALMYHYGTNDGLNKPAENIKHLVNFALVDFKNADASVTGNMMVLIKKTFDAVTSAILYRKWKNIRISLKVFKSVMGRLSTIKRSRKEQAKEYAFLKCSATSGNI